MATVRLFHGTAHAFDVFDERFTMHGTEPNSALGIHLTERPELAAEYARLAARDSGAREPRVLAIDFEADRIALVGSHEEFLGPPDGFPLEETRSWSEFIEARLHLSGEGYDGIAADEIGGDLEGAWVAFDPSRLRIVGTMTPAEAETLGEEHDLGFWPGLEFETVTLFEDDALPVPQPRTEQTVSSLRLSAQGHSRGRRRRAWPTLPPTSIARPFPIFQQRAWTEGLSGQSPTTRRHCEPVPPRHPASGTA